MTWQETIKGLGGGDFTFLSTDGECITFIVVDDPVILTSRYKGKEQLRIGCPVITEEGFQLFITGKRLARKISKYQDVFATTAFMAVRHGEEGDINSTYSLSVVNDKAVVTKLWDIAAKEYNTDVLLAAVNAATEVLGQ